MKYVVTVACIMATQLLFAQFIPTSQKDLAQIKEATLLVGFEEPDPKQLEKLQKKGKEYADNYLAQIEGRNAAIKYAIENHWDFTNKIEYKDGYEANQMASEDEKYVVIQFGQYLDTEYYTHLLNIEGMPAGWSKDESENLQYNPLTKYTETANEIVTLEIRGQVLLAEMYLPSPYVSKPDAIFGVETLQYLLEYLDKNPKNKVNNFLKYIDGTNAQLAKLTLLVDKREIHNKLSLDLFKENYPYPFEWVDQATIEKAILSKDPNYAYLQIVASPSASGNAYTHILTGAEDGKVFKYFISKSGINKYENQNLIFNNRVKERHVKKYFVK